MFLLKKVSLLKFQKGFENLINPDTNHYKYYLKFSILLSFFYLCIMFVNNVFLAQPLGDEWYFTNDLNYYVEHGYKESVINGMSIPFTLLTYVLNIILNDISLSLRVVNSTFVFIFILYMYKQIQGSRNKYIFFYYLFLLIGTTGGLFYGTNDSMFFCALIIMVFESCNKIFNQNEKKSYLLLIIASIICISTRPIAVIYLPLISFSVFIFKLIFAKEVNNKILINICGCIILSLLVIFVANYPRIKNYNFNLSYANKADTYKTDDPNFNWTQWSFYSQMKGNKNRLGLFAPMVNWEEVREYNNFNNVVKLPKNTLDYLTQHPLFVIRRIPTSIIESLIISLRYVGILLLFLPYYIYKKVDSRNLDSNILFAIIVIVGIIIWTAIIPHLVEHRWYFPLYVMLIFIFSKDSNNKQFNQINVFNMALMNFITLWALYKEKLFYSI